jgi:hypothetical protein
MSSTMAGPTPSSARAAAIIPSSRSPSPSRRPPARACWRRRLQRRRNQGAALAAGLKTFAERAGVSSVHVTFAEPDEADILEAAGYPPPHRPAVPFLQSEGYGTYDDFLATLASRKRKALKQGAARGAVGRHRDRLADRQATHRSVWDDFFAFYMDTGGTQMGPPLPQPRNSSRWSANAWPTTCCWSWPGAPAATSPAPSTSSAPTRSTAATGAASRTTPSCISRSATTRPSTSPSSASSIVEAGAQGEHKLARGYMPVTTHSAHHIVHPGLRGAVADYLERERREVAEIGDYLGERGPFRQRSSGRPDGVPSPRPHRASLRRRRTQGSRGGDGKA